MTMMKELTETIIRSIVDNPDKVEVTELLGQNSVVVEVRVDQTDMGKVIGRKGNTANSIRTILTAAGKKMNKRCTLEILE
jgi:uncharacterized protein